MSVSISRRGLLGAAGALGAATTGWVTTGAAHATPRAGTGAATAAITRLLGGDTGAAGQFRLSLHTPEGEADGWRIAGAPGAVELSGTSTVALVSAFHWWLKYVAGCHLSTNEDRVALPATLPAPNRPISGSTSLTDRYAYNFTVFGYTMPYWTWDQWEREIDYLAASGVNQALMLVGQEIVWYETFTRFGMDEDDVRNWIAQPAHQPWQWYGEITGYDEGASAYSGPVSADLMTRRAELGRRIADRMRELGIVPVFPVFIGTVPDQVFSDRHPSAHIVQQADYAGHPRPYWLDPTEALFDQIADRFYAVQTAHFGTTTHYSNDLLHEVSIDDEADFLDGVDLAEAATAVSDALHRAVPDAVWILQAWQDNPRRRLIEALDPARTLVIDLDADDGPKWQDTAAFWGTPWAWGTIQNFGGRLGMFGNITEPGQTLPRVRALPAGQRGRLTGTAMMLEGTHHNPVVADLLAEMPWRQDPVDLSAWITAYAARRYGVDDPHAAAAWSILLQTAYSYQATGHSTGEGPFETPFAAEPALTVESVSSFGPTEWRYPPEDFEPALGELLAAPAGVRALDTYRYDLVDVTRQVLANRGRLLLDDIRAAYRRKDTTTLRRLTARFLRYIDLTDELLATHRHWLLGPWLEQAKAWAAADEEQAILEWNARSIVTIWSDKACPVLHEYANRDWQGLVGFYYRSRWERYFDALPATISSGRPPQFDDWCEFGNAWSRQTDSFPTEPTGDTYELAQVIADELTASPARRPPGTKKHAVQTSTITTFRDSHA
jgi:alpha-N-acetylglucosaminidase